VIPKITVRPGVNLEKEIEALGLKDKIISQAGKLTQVEAHLVEITDGKKRVWVKKDDLAEGISRYLIATKNLGNDPGLLRAQAHDPKKPTKDVDQAAVAKYRVLEKMLEGEVLGKLARNRIIERVAEQFAVAKVNEQRGVVAADESQLRGLASKLRGGKGIEGSVAGLRAQRAEAVSLPTLKQLKKAKMDELDADLNTYDFLVGLQKSGKLTTNQKQQLKTVADRLVQAGVLQKQGRVFKEYGLADAQRIAKKDLNPEEQRTYDKLMDEAIKEYSKVSTDSGKYKRLSEELADRPVSGLKGLVTNLIDKQFKEAGRNELRPDVGLVDFFAKMTGASEAPESTKGTIAQLPESVPEAFDKVISREADQLTKEELENNDKFKKLDEECNDFLTANRFSKADIMKIKKRVDKAVDDFKPGNKLPMVPFPQIAGFKGGGEKGVVFMRKAIEHEIIRRDTFLKHYELLKGNVPRGVDTSAGSGGQTGSAGRTDGAGRVGSAGSVRDMSVAEYLKESESEVKWFVAGPAVAPRLEINAAGVEVRRDESGGAEKEDKEKGELEDPVAMFLAGKFIKTDPKLAPDAASRQLGDQIRESARFVSSVSVDVEPGVKKTVTQKSKELDKLAAKLDFEPKYVREEWKAFLINAEKTINDPYLSVEARKAALDKLSKRAEQLGNQAILLVANWNKPEAMKAKELANFDSTFEQIQEDALLLSKGNVEQLMLRYIPGYADLQFARQFIRARVQGEKLWVDKNGVFKSGKENPKKGEWQEVSPKLMQKHIDSVQSKLIAGKIAVPDDHLVADFARLVVSERVLPKIAEEAAKTWKTDPKARDVFVAPVGIGLMRRDKSGKLPPASLEQIQKYVADRGGAEAFVKGETADAIQLYLALRERVLTVDPKERFDFVSALKTLNELETVLNRGTVRTERFRK
jgi:hypothetical protein